MQVRRARRTTGLLATLAVVAALATASAAPPEPAAAAQDGGPALAVQAPRTPTGRFGFTQGSALIWESDTELAADLDGMVAAGAAWVAVDVDWPSVQAGGPDSWNWAPTDRVVAAARARGLSVIGLAVYSPAWARPEGTSDKFPPSDPAAYGTFVGTAAARYAPLGVHTWQVWNEPNVEMFWEGGPDAAAYAALLSAAHAAAHAADPEAVVLAGGLAPAVTVAGHTQNPNEFLAAVYAAGGAGRLDGVAMHPYSFPFAPTTAATWNTFYMLTLTHQIMAVNGDGAKKIWATEVGFGTGGDASSVSASTQATRIAQVMAAWRRLPFASVMLLYNYRDLATGSAAVFDNMGLVRHDGTPKVSLRAFRRAALGGAAASRIGLHQSGINRSGQSTLPRSVSRGSVRRSVRSGR